MEPWAQIALTAFTAISSSSGLWAWMVSRDKQRAATTRLLMGLAYRQITERGMEYIDRGHITKDELEEFQKYLYEPYKALGGNGTGDVIMTRVRELTLVHYSRFGKLNEETTSVPVRLAPSE